jgi:4-hydroxybenzoate polyprenyltransferase
MSTRRLLRTLAMTCHPLPTAAVTTFALLLAVGADRPRGTVALVGVAVLAGQLSIGWGNDLIDRRRDALAHRADKPLADGDGARAVLVACAVATIAAVALAPVLGGRAGIAQLVVLGGGWVYNAGLKATAWSWLPYLVAFAALPIIPLEAVGGDPAPVWLAACAGVVGVAAHLFNAAPDVDDDRAAGVQGAPARWGAVPSVSLGLVLLGAATIVAASASEASAPAQAVLLAIGVAAVVGGAVLMVSAARTGRQGATVPRAVFPAALLLIAVEVGILIVSV